MDERTIEEALSAWVALVEAHSAAMDAVEAVMTAEAGLPLSWHEVLVRLSRAEQGSMRMQELARAVLLSKSGLSRLADRMEAAGLIERSSCGADRRGIYAVITAAGREALERARPVFLEAVERHFAAHLDGTELATLERSLRKVSRGEGIGVDEQCDTSDLTEPPPEPVRATVA